MTNSDIRRYARETIVQLPGRHLLFVTPVILNCLLLIANLHRQVFMPAEAALRLETQLLPQLLNVLLIFFNASASLVMLAVIRKQRQEVRFTDSTLIFEKPILTPFIKVLLVRQLFLLPWTIVLEVSPYLILALEKNSLSNVVILGVLVYLLVFVIYIRQVCAYSMSIYLLFDQLASGLKPNPFHIVKASQILMKGHLGRYFALELSFVGWYLLNFLTLGLSGFYVFPYHATAQLVFYQDRIQKVRQANLKAKSEDLEDKSSSSETQEQQ